MIFLVIFQTCVEMTDFFGDNWTSQSRQSETILKRYFEPHNQDLTLNQVRSTKSREMKMKIDKALKSTNKLIWALATFEEKSLSLIQVNLGHFVQATYTHCRV